MVAEKKNTLILLSTAAFVVAVMAGYYFWTGRKTTEEKTTVVRKPPRRGVITGIMYAEEKSSVAINGKIVHEAETIDGVKVVKIYRDKVEFEESKNRWTQQVQQRPNHTWPNVD